jgi:uncharacterized protein (DUF433 family)
MTYRLALQTSAVQDVQEAYDWYEGQKAGLGDEFLETVEQGLALIEQNPLLFPKIYLHSRLTEQNMAAVNLSERIEINPKVLNGKPVIKGTRLSVQFILGLLAQGMTQEEILAEYYRLSPEDIRACLDFTA